MFLSELISILDARSFASPWFWLVLISVWTLSGRGVLGVPNEVLTRAGQALRHDDAAVPRDAELLLDWLSLQLPRWKLGPRPGAILTAAVAFGLTLLGVLGFRYGLEMAQALTLIAAPFALLLLLKLRLASQLDWVMEALHLGQPPRAAAIEAMRRINQYRVMHTIISLLAVMVTALWASLWIALHPNGM